VPVQKCSKFNKKIFSSKLFIPIRTYITLSQNQIKYDDNNYVKVYENILDMKKDILNENGGKSGIYMLTNKLTKEIYVGQSINLSNRFKNYLNLSYIKSKNSFRISKALIKYGYSNFSLTILEYCNKSNLQAREQYYFDKLNPQYNILKMAGSSLKSKHTEKTKKKFSQTLKGVYVGENSALFDKHHTKETKKLMSLKKVKENNPLFEKTHSENSIELMRQKVLNRKQFEDTKLKLNVVSGNPVNIYEKFSSKGFKLIGSFVSVRRAGKFLGISGNTVIKYMNSGEIFKNRYKFSSK
jgi:group I intron endonuclease